MGTSEHLLVPFAKIIRDIYLSVAVPHDGLKLSIVLELTTDAGSLFQL